MGFLPTNRRAKVIGLAGLAGILAVSVVAVVIAAGRPPQPPHPSGASAAADPDGEEGGNGAFSVKAIRPKNDPSFVISVEEPAYVEGYYVADLQARVAGPVDYIKKDLGDPVKKGEVLARIAVPDLDQEVLQKTATVAQRDRELKVARANARVAEAAVAVTRDTIEEKEADRDAAEGMRKFRASELSRFTQLAQGDQSRGLPGVVTPYIVDERKQAYVAAEAALRGAAAAIRKAKSDLAEYQAKSEAAAADVELKQALVEVAKKDRERVQALRDYAEIKAPFDGVITRRNFDPGSFVQNATTAHTPPVFTVERNDIVTVYMKVPDNYAPYVTRDTEAVIEMSELPGQLIHAKVSRFTPSLQTPEHDRTMRVEVDLYNGTEAEYQRFLNAENQKGQTAAGTPFDDLKGTAVPVFPQVTGKNALAAGEHRLLPGMFGKMRLLLHKFRNAYLIPSNAVYSQGGKPYIFEVKNGTIRQVPVEVQVDDGRLAKVSVIAKVGGAEVRQNLTGDEEIVISNLQNLTGDEEIVISNLGEIGDGQVVRATLADW